MNNLMLKEKVFGVLMMLLFITSCSNDDDSPETLSSEFANASVKLDEEVETFIESDGKVTVKVLGIFEDGNAVSVQKGFVYGTSPKPSVEGNDELIQVETNTRIEIKELEQNTTYYVRGFIKSDKGNYFYGNEISINTPKQGDQKAIKMVINAPVPEGISTRSIFLSTTINEMTGEAPIEVGVQYSTSEDFSSPISKKSDKEEIQRGSYTVDILFLNPSKKYYLRPYAKYQDNSILNGGTSVIEVTTDDLKLGDFYPLSEGDFASDMSSSNYLVMEVDLNLRTALLVRKSDIEVSEGWKTSYNVAGNLEVRNPSKEELIKMKALDTFDVTSEGVTVDLLLFAGRFEDFTSQNYWTSQIDGTQNAFVYNPITTTQSSISKEETTQKGRFVVEINF